MADNYERKGGVDLSFFERLHPGDQRALDHSSEKTLDPDEYKVLMAELSSGPVHERAREIADKIASLIPQSA